MSDERHPEGTESIEGPLTAEDTIKEWVPPGGAFDILLVEDDDAAAMFIARGVSSMGLKVRRAHNGEQAILITQNELPSLVLMDTMMPRLDGLETTRYFKTFYSGYLPVMVITAREDRESLQKAFEAGVDDYMTKPVRIADLRMGVQRLLALREAEELASTGDEDGVNEVVRLRLEIAEGLCHVGRYLLAEHHLKRLRRLAPDHEGVKALARKLEL